MFGSDSRWRIDWNGFMSRSTNGASAMSTVTGVLFTSTTWPSALRRTSSSEMAIPSTAPMRDRLARPTWRPPSRRWRRPSRRSGPRVFGDRADVGHRVVLDLLADRAGQVLAAGADRGCRADVRARRHVGEGRGQGDEGSGAGGPTAARGDIHDRRERRLEQRRDDPLRRVEAAAGRIEHDDDGRRGRPRPRA